MCTLDHRLPTKAAWRLTQPDTHCIWHTARIRKHPCFEGVAQKFLACHTKRVERSHGFPCAVPVPVGPKLFWESGQRNLRQRTFFTLCRKLCAKNREFSNPQSGHKWFSGGWKQTSRISSSGARGHSHMTSIQLSSSINDLVHICLLFPSSASFPPSFPTQCGHHMYEWTLKAITIYVCTRSVDNKRVGNSSRNCN